MIKSILLLLAGISFLLGQTIDPYLQHFSQQTQLNKGRAVQIRLLVKGDPNLDHDLQKAGFRIQSTMGSYRTVSLPANRIEELARLSSVKRISFTPPARLLNSAAVSYQNVQYAYNKGYTGSHVIVGIVDTGIDFYHPAFRKQNGDTRILDIWDQTQGTAHPDGYSYGTEYTEAQINQDLQSGSPYSIVKQHDTQGHGTHVAGSAAGRDFTISPQDTLDGGAIEANIIIVKTTLNTPDILDGVDYIFKKAAALGKPCVVNLSLGSQYGPHDGTDDDTQAMDALTGAGKIVVRSAGNEGSSSIHYLKTSVTSSDQIQFGYTDYFTVWIESGDLVSSISLSWDNGSIDNVPINGHKNLGKIDVYLQSASASDNHEIAGYVFMDDTTYQNKTFTLTLNSLQNANNNKTIIRHAWCASSTISAPYGGFSQGTAYANPFYPYTLANGACGTEAITVGAFISRESWPASDGKTYHYVNAGKRGGIASFSSIGPTADNGKKPDIIAGGSIILSARSKDASFSTSFLPPSPYTEHYAYMQGTSMAAPVATGAIALLLDKNPDWTPADVKDYLFHHAQGTHPDAGVTTDQTKVKDDPNTWDRVFGYGAIDLTAAFDAQAIDEGTSQHPARFTLMQNYPNPFGQNAPGSGNNSTTIIRYTLRENSRVELTIYNALGQLVKKLINAKQLRGSYRVPFNAHNLASGLYYYRLKVGSSDFVQTRKMIILH